MRSIHVFFTLFVVGGAAAQTGVTTHHVAGPVHMIEGRGGNIGVSAGTDGLLIIDTQYANMAGPIQDALDELNNGPLAFVINTHFHGDHTGGNAALADDTPVVAHENVRTRLIGRRDPADPELRNALPWVTYDDDLTLYFNDERIDIVHFPSGHTDGDSMIFFRGSNVVHMGDHFFVERFPFIDLAAGGDVQGYIANVEKALEVLPDDIRIIPGHGALATKDDLRAFHTLLTESVGHIRERIEAGLDHEAIEDEGMPEKFAEAAAGFVGERRWISIVYQSYTR